MTSDAIAISRGCASVACGLEHAGRTFPTYDRSRFMNKTFTFLAVAALASGSNLAFAQSPAFADTFAEMQALSSNSSQWQPTQPSVGREAVAPRSRLTLRDYQALSSNSSQWQLGQGQIGIDNGPTFAKTHPQGIPFAEYQAVATNSDQYAA